MPPEHAGWHAPYWNAVPAQPYPPAPQYMFPPSTYAHEYYNDITPAWAAAPQPQGFLRDYPGTAMPSEVASLNSKYYSPLEQLRAAYDGFGPVWTTPAQHMTDPALPHTPDPGSHIHIDPGL